MWRERTARRTTAGWITVILIAALAAGRNAAAGPGTSGPAGASGLPQPDHVVIVVEENKSFSDIIGNSHAPYINALAHQGALFTRSFAVAHPSEPNYLALFSGSTHNVTDDSCPHTFKGTNLASELFGKGLTFGMYSQGLPEVGYTGCSAKAYWRKHNPAVNWQGADLPRFANMPFLLFTIVPGKYDHLPTVSMVAPDQDHDMHDGSIKQGDTWLKTHIAPYVQWARTHNSLLIVTWDEDDGSGDNRIPTLFVGPMVKPGTYRQRIDHYSVLRTVTAMYGLDAPGKSAHADPIRGVWIKGAPGPAGTPLSTSHRSRRSTRP